MITIAEKGIITLEKNVIIFEGHSYSLTQVNGQQPQAQLHLKEGNMESVSIQLFNGVKYFIIDPQRNLYSYFKEQIYGCSASGDKIYSSCTF